MTFSLAWIFTALVMVAIVVPISFRAQIRQVLTSRNRQVSPGGCVLGFWGLPFRDLAQLRDLIKSEPDSLMRPKYIRLERSFYVSSALAMIFLAWLFIFKPFGAFQKAPPQTPATAKP